MQQTVLRYSNKSRRHYKMLYKNDNNLQKKKKIYNLMIVRHIQFWSYGVIELDKLINKWSLIVRVDSFESFPLILSTKKKNKKI